MPEELLDNELELVTIAFGQQIFNSSIRCYKGLTNLY